MDGKQILDFLKFTFYRIILPIMSNPRSQNPLLNSFGLFVVHFTGKS